MDASPTPTELPSLAELHAQDARHFRGMLVGLADGGAELAALYVQHAKDKAYSGKPGAGPAPEIATAHSGVSRAVRQTVLLAQTLTALAPKPSEPAPDRIVIRKQIIRNCGARPVRPAGALAGLRGDRSMRSHGRSMDGSLAGRPAHPRPHPISQPA